MSYPQTTPVQATLQNQDFWRLLTNIESSGDIYEANTSARGFCIGPESDIARAAITYPDPTQPTQMMTQEVGIGKALVGGVSSNLNEKYATGQTSRVLISLKDLMYPPNYRVIGPSTDAEMIYFPPVLDLIQYLQSTPNISPGRNDKTYRFNGAFSATSEAEGYVAMIPFFGRRFFYATMKNRTNGTTVACTFFGINFSYRISSTVTQSFHQQIQLGSVNVAGNAFNDEFGLPIDTEIVVPKYDYIAMSAIPDAATAIENFTATITVGD